jgi:SAM-dependent methyltransferase
MRKAQKPPAPAVPEMASAMRTADSADFGARADAYDRHLGRYSASLAPQMVRLATVTSGQRALDVGCGPGALASALAATLGPERVAAVDPYEPFVKACRARVAGADVRVAAAERLPFAEDHFDVVLAQLVLDLVEDPQRAVTEMRRVLRLGGVIAACVWDYAGEMTILRAFWDAAAALDPLAATARDEGRRKRLCQRGELGQLWRSQGIERIEEGELIASARYADFEAFWSPFQAGIGPAGAYCKALGGQAQAALHEECWRGLGSPMGAFYLSARAWFVIGRN